MKTKFLSLLILLGSFLIVAQDATLNGSVSDSYNDGPLPGVSVVISGTQNGTTTDFNGNFSLSGVSVGDVIQFSYIGYLTKDVTVGSSFNLSVSLDEDVESLDEVILIGYSTQKSSNISGAVSTVSGDDVQKLKPLRVEDALQGQAGLNVISSGSPGGKPSVLIRGITSFSGTDPLVVIDGINSSLWDMDAINPANIESISVLKDASTTALYGVRGGNGVIVITTKSGKKNQETVFSLDTSFGMQGVNKYIDVLNASQYAAILNEGSVSSGGPIIFSNLSLGAGTNWQKELFNTAPISTTNFSASGGDSKSTYFLSAGYTSQEGVAVGGDKDFFDAATFTANFTSELSDDLKVIVHTKFSNLQGNGLGGNQINNALNFDPMIKPMVDGAYGMSSTITQEIINPLAGVSNSYSDNKTDKLIGKIELQYQLMDDFKITSRLGYSSVWQQQKGFTPLQFYGIGHNRTNANADLSQRTADDHNRVSETKQNWFNYSYELFGNYDFSLNEEHNFNVFAGFTIGKSTNNGLSGSNVDVPFNSWTYADLSSASGGIEDQSTGSWQSVSRSVSLMGRVEYDFQEKYLASVTIRRDGSTSFGKNNKFAVFPSASIGWVASNEDFFNSSTINFLKVRASYGTVGNDNASPQFGTISTFPKYTFGQTIYSGSTLLGIPNNDVSWENQTQTNLGVDLRMFDSKFKFTADYFIKSVDDLLFSPTLSLYLGIPSYPVANIGKTETKGYELSLSYGSEISENVSFNTTFNFTAAENLVKEINNGDKYIWGSGYGIPYTSLTQFRQGESPGIFWGYKTNGIFQNQSEISNHATQNNAQPGDIRFVDVDGNGKIDAEDRTKIGDPFPDFTLGWNFSLTVSDFDLSVFTYASVGNDIFRGYERGLNYTNKFASVLNRWTGAGTSTTEPRYSFIDANNNSRASDRYVEDGSFVKIKNIQLGYNFPLGEASPFSSMRIYALAKNAFTFTEYTGYDPEISNGGSPVLDTGIDRGTYPSPRIVSLGLNLKF
jgi:TonB-linked SusC/RagA family outer membrane protein|tara:strand:+ start:2487 stop:5513 length:3027 start_codon:yes stop_codon:yes gene_type:complete